MVIEVESFYRDKITDNEALLGRNKRLRGILLAAKLVTFAALVTTIYYAFYDLSLLFSILPAVGYLVALYIDASYERGARLLKELIRGYNIEIAYLNGDLCKLDGGKEYCKPSHNFSLDLDIFGDDSLFIELNRSVTPLGRDILARNILEPTLDREAIIERQNSVEELAGHREWMQNFMAKGRLNPLSSYSRERIATWIKIDYFDAKKLKIVLYTINCLALLALILALTAILPYTIFIALTTIQLGLSVAYMSKINKMSADLDGVVKSISNYLYLIDQIKELDVQSKELIKIKNRLFEGDSSIGSFKRLKRIQSQFDQRSNILTLILLNSLYARDIHSAIDLISWRKRYAEDIEKWVETTSHMDALISMANYRFNHPDYIFADISEEEVLSAKELAHPLMREESVVTNDFKVDAMHNYYIITGANMAGKSTFLRAVGINIVLALAALPVRAKQFSLMPIDLFTSMRTTDNLSKGTSYFHAELLRLKALHSRAESGRRLFIIVDEMLKGTNSVDKLNGSLKFLVRLLTMNISGIVATHDLALGDLASSYPDNFTNICFEIEHIDDDIIYSYKLQEGVSKNMNASLLLEKMDLI